MSLSAPKQITFIIAVVLAVLGLLAYLVPMGAISGLAVWLIIIGFVVLAAGCMAPNL